MENKGQPEKKTQDTPKPAKPADAYTEKDLTDLMQQIKSRMTGSGELEQLRKENQELKEKVKRYETFISVLADIFNTTVN
jgi:predicted RNase H-like nuclease (RuvC/YqgF family)